jgi:hypothetical protein
LRGGLAAGEGGGATETGGSEEREEMDGEEEEVALGHLTHTRARPPETLHMSLRNTSW